MAHYAIGDIQGCYHEFLQLLEKIHFDAECDQLWLAGDLVNRGPDSLAVLRYVHKLGQSVVAVLGNHDLHLLALAAGVSKIKAKDTLGAILAAPDREILLDWLSHCPLMHVDPKLNYIMLHAGLPPQWGVQLALSLAKEVETVLRGPSKVEFFQHMYGNKPDLWCNELSGWERLRIIVNCFTRIRFVDQTGALDLSFKGEIGQQAGHLLPWFQHPKRKTQDQPILFGHWAALDGQSDDKNIIALDTGCVWGGSLSALRLEDGQWFRVPACQARP